MKINKKFILWSTILLATFLRIWQIEKVPVSLFGDELDVGYQAYSIIQTGRDYNGNFMPLHFQSLAEWRTPLYLYSCVPTVLVFGISPLGVRLPAIIFGVLGVWMIYLLVSELFKNGFVKLKKNVDYEKIGLVSAFVMAISPWHIQYSRAAFEVTQMIFFYMAGLYFFFKALKTSKYLWLSVLFLILTPWVYSTAKLFTPMLLAFLIIVWFKDLFKFPKKEIAKAVVILLVFGLPMVYEVFFGGASQRFNYISTFSDPAMEGDVGFSRLNDAAYEGQDRNILEKASSRIIHNKYTYWGNRILNNMYSAVSTNFLFNTGDPNRRQNIEGMGELYKIDLVPLILGLTLFLAFFRNNKVKALVVFWLVAGTVPSSLTRDGATHATRLILILPPLLMLVAYGLVDTFQRLPKFSSKIYLFGYAFLLLICFYFYQHNYWLHNPWYSERWWHAGFKETVRYLKENESDYDKIIFSTAGEPPYIFFAGWYEYSPSKWQKGFRDVNIAGFSTLGNNGKYYFGQMEKIGIYDLWHYMPDSGLYVAVAKEVNINLIMEPDRVPPGLKLLKAIPYPSGEPAFYIFEKAQ